MNATTTHPTDLEVAPMFTATVSAGSHAEALEKVQRRLVAGFTATGRVAARSERHRLIDVEVAGDGDRNDCWVMLTSYGISPSSALGSTWANVPGVGR